MTPSLEGRPTKAKEAPSPHEVRLTPLDTKPVFQCLREKQLKNSKNNSKPLKEPAHICKSMQVDCQRAAEKIRHTFYALSILVVKFRYKTL